MLYGGKTWPIKEVIWLEINNAKMVRWLCNVRPENRISVEKPSATRTLKNMIAFLQDRRLHWFGHLERL